MSEQDILRRLKELEKENQALRKAAGVSQPKETTSVVGMYKGHPIITFEGQFRPFSLGVRKASVILDKIEEVKHFVANNKKHLGKSSDGENLGEIV